MPCYKIQFSRTCTITEGFERVIEAPSSHEALAAARNLCSDYNRDCPDDCSELESGNTEISGFEAELPPIGCDVPDRPDMQILPDGQLVDVMRRTD